MSTISASTTSTTAYKVTADTTGTLVLQTGASPTTAMTIDASQNVTFARGISSGLNVSGAGWGVLPYISNSLVIDNNAGQARFFATGDASNFGSYIWYGGKTGGSTSTYMALDASGNLLVNDTSAQYSAKLYVNGSIAARNSGVDGTFQNAFVVGYTSNYTEKNIIQTAVSSGASGSGFRFQVSNGAGSSAVTTAMDIVRSQINFYANGSIIANVQSQGIYMSGGNWIYWDKSGTRSWQMYCNQTSANLLITSGDGNGTIQLVSSAVQVNGSLSKGSGSFRIEHPLPELAPTHQLVHSFIEGPQADLIYRGKVNLVNGTATINIDQAAGMTEGTFVVLCRDVQCFTTNESDWTAVRGSVSGNILMIEAQDNTSTASISWMVIGERQDKHMMETEWTDSNGKVIVEPLKPVEPQPETTEGAE